MKALLPAILCLFTAAAPARDAAGRLVFEKDVRPVLKAHCFHCHGEGEKPKGGLDLRLRRFMTGESEEGKILVPGKPQESQLWKKVHSGEMPKGEKKLSAEEMGILEKWIAQGARTARPEPESLPRGFYLTEEDKSFWSFQPIQRPPIPKVKSRDAVRRRTPIDDFLMSRLKKEKLSMAPPAEKMVLIRRVYLDLWGLPPTPEEVDDFLADKSPDAYEKIVDRLLASPRYGERWGRHWLDVAGYADSNGFSENDSRRPHAWRFRDYVVRSFNEDKPFDRFIIEQLAGDELAGPVQGVVRPEQVDLLTATGFLRMAPDGTGDQVPDPNLAKNQVVAETIKIVSSSLLGLTVGCAQCHDHRYDPISQQDYHRLRAVFEPALDWKNWKAPSQRLVSLYTPEDRAKADEIEKAAQKMDADREKKYREFLDKVFERELLKLPEAIRETVRTARNTPAAKRTPEQIELFKTYPAADVQFALDLYDPPSHKIIVDELAKAAQWRATKPKEEFIMVLTEPPGSQPESFVFYRGDHEQPREKVAPGELSVLAAYHPGEIPAKSAELPTSGRRLQYARWLTDGKHPLVARVLVNRVWLNHFGQGLVATPGDFGKLGTPPDHPELLDWLASDFMENGWKLKRLHKMILLSAVYQQSTHNPRSLETDPANKWYARMKLKRLDAETLRDSLLAVSGSINLVQYGAPVPVAQDFEGRVITGQQVIDGNGLPSGATSLGAQENRRSIYVESLRRQPLTVLETFDGPMMSPNCEIRSSTTVAPQSLLLMNDHFILEQSRRLAQRLQKEFPDDLPYQVARAWRLLYGEHMEIHDVLKAVQFVEEQKELFLKQTEQIKDKAKADAARASAPELAMASLCQVLMSANRFLYE